MALCIEMPGVPHVERIEGPGQAGFRMGDTDVVDVVRHQVKGLDIGREAFAALSEPTEIDLVITGFLECGVTVGLELMHEVGEARGNSDKSLDLVYEGKERILCWTFKFNMDPNGSEKNTFMNKPTGKSDEDRMIRVPSINALISVLYLKGIAMGSFHEPMEAILGPNAAGLSATPVNR
jgi:hypothetical protein